MVSTSVDIPEDASYDEALEVVEGRLYNGARVTPEWAGLKRVAEIKDEDRNLVTESQTTHAEIVEELKKRNPGVPPWAFEPRTSDAKKWTGIRAAWARNTEYDPDDWDDRGRLVSRPE